MSCQALPSVHAVQPQEQRADLQTQEVRQEAGCMKFRMQNLRQAGRNSRKRKGLAVVWLNLPGNTLRAAGDLSQLKIRVNSG